MLIGGGATYRHYGFLARLIREQTITATSPGPPSPGDRHRSVTLETDLRVAAQYGRLLYNFFGIG
jgi:hypothetical protein